MHNGAARLRLDPRMADSWRQGQYTVQSKAGDGSKQRRSSGGEGGLVAAHEDDPKLDFVPCSGSCAHCLVHDV